MTSLRLALPFLLGLSLLPACIDLAPKADPTRFYVLTPPEPGQGSFSGQPQAVSIRIAHLPDYLDQPRLIVRQGRNEIAFAEYHRWAEPLPDALPRVLAAGIEAALPYYRVSVYPAEARGDNALEVSLWVQRFEATREGEVRVSLRWEIENTDEKGLFSTSVAYRERTEIAALLSTALAQAARDIATSLNEATGVQEAFRYSSNTPSPSERPSEPDYEAFKSSEAFDELEDEIPVEETREAESSE